MDWSRLLCEPDLADSGSAWIPAVFGCSGAWIKMVGIRRDPAHRILHYGIFGINVDFSRSLQSGFFLRKKSLEGRAFGLQ
jgi:hypothetical protein